MHTGEINNVKPLLQQHSVRRSAYLKYHWTLFFFQWLKLRIKMFGYGLNAICWGMKHKCFLSVPQMIDMLKWNSWKQYKVHGTYLLKKENGLWMITGRDMKEVLLRHFA